MPGYPTIWNRDCMNDIIFFITNLMKDRKISRGLKCKETLWKVKVNPKAVSKFTRNENE